MILSRDLYLSHKESFRLLNSEIGNDLGMSEHPVTEEFVFVSLTRR